MKKTWFVFLFSLSALAVERDLSQSSPAPAAPRGRPGKTVYDFSEVDILGKLKSPEGKNIMERPDTQFKRLFDLEESFIPNIIRSVDDF